MKNYMTFVASFCVHRLLEGPTNHPKEPKGYSKEPKGYTKEPKGCSKNHKIM